MLYIDDCLKCLSSNLPAEDNLICAKGYLESLMRKLKQFDYDCETIHKFDLEEIGLTKSKTLHNSPINGTRTNVKDLQAYGDIDLFKCLAKASSDSGGWMKTTKAMEITGVGCLVQVTSRQGDNIAEALTFVPGAKIIEIDGNKENGRKLVMMQGDDWLPK